MNSEFFILIFLGFIMLGCFYFVMQELNRIGNLLEDLTKPHCEIKSPKIEVSFADGTTCEVEKSE